MSYWPDDLTAIQYAVGRGVIVVEAAGNGAEHLDDDAFGGPGPGFRPHRPNPFRRDGLDSGSILVGAGAPPGGRAPDRSRLRFSNWGTAIDAQGWGRDVATTGGLGPGADEARPGADEDAWYTGGFAGTSSAAPMVAGALACVQGVLRAQGRAPLDPARARVALRETGSSQQAAAGERTLERIGNRPDIAELIEWGLDATRPVRRTTPRPRRNTMRVTITIDDDGDGPAIEWGPALPGAEGPHIRGPHIRGPYIRGPHIVIPREDGTETEVDIAGLAAAAEERKPQA
jgi:Subtilase family